MHDAPCGSLQEPQGETGMQMDAQGFTTVTNKELFYCFQRILFSFFDADICYCVIVLSSIIRSLAVDESLVVIRFLYVLELPIILITYLLLFNLNVRLAGLLHMTSK